MILKENGTTMKLWRKTSAVSFAAKKSPERGVSSPYLSRTKPPLVFAGESNLTALALACKAAFSRGGTYWLVQEKVRLVNRPRKRNSRLSKTDKANAVFLTGDIMNEVKL